MHLSISHITRVVVESGFWACIYIFYSNQSSLVVNLRGLDKYGSKHTGSHTNMQAKIGGMYKQIRTDGLYIYEKAKI